MQTEKIKIGALFATYSTVRELPSGEKVSAVRTAWRGDEVDVPVSEAERLKAAGALDVPEDRDAFAVYNRAVSATDRAEEPNNGPVEAVPPPGGRQPVGQVLNRDISDDGQALPDVSTTEAAATWIETSEPKASEVVDAAAGDPERARVLLAAEQHVQGGDGRKTVVGPLQKIIDGDSA